MKLIAAYTYYFIAQARRNKGLYDSKTLSFYEKSCKRCDIARFHAAYARIQREVNGSISHETLDILKNSSPELLSRITLGNLAVENDRKPILKQPEIHFSLNDVVQRQTEWRQELSVFLQNKTIAIVGNGPALINTSLGKAIDACMVTCRFNDFPTTRDVINDTGYKVDIWITSPNLLKKNKTLPSSVKWIIISGPDARYTLKDWRGADHHLKQKRRIITIPLSAWTFLVKKYKSPPSSGMLWINYLLSIKNLNANLNIYGFNKYKFNDSGYHINSKLLKPSVRHAWAKEKLHLNSLALKKKIDIHYPNKIATFSQGILKNELIRRHLNSNDMQFQPSSKCAKYISLVVGWGKKANTDEAITYSNKHNISYAHLEDGFIHSMSQGRLGAASWSLVVDKTGIFYDATQTSDLENLINTTTLTNEETSRAKSCINQITTHHITKYNNAPLIAPAQLKQYKDPVLVLDQVEGDMSIPFAMASPDTFKTMLSAAISENPNSDILIKVHPDVINGKRKGCILLPKERPANLHVLTDNINPLELMKHVDKVYVVSSQAGFEALMLNKEVICFGVPFYAGWGLTSDRFDRSLPVVSRRKNKPSFETIFHATYISYSRYLDPISKRPCEIESILDHVARQHSYYLKNSGLLLCIGLTPWKKRFIKSHLKNPDNKLYFIKKQEDAKKHHCDDQTKLLVWSNKHLTIAKAISKTTNAKIVKIEDGFLRSVNLGSNYTLPSSLVFDEKGIYFDPTTESDLESILNNHEFDEEFIKRASELRKKIVSLGVSKYNLGIQTNEHLPEEAANKKIILIPGQVADDASIRLGCIDIDTNLELLEVVKKANPNAFIIYKPHPDVVSDNRAGEIPTELALKYCDYIIEDQSISICLEYADEVHTLTSLVGFEALLRGLTVYCYGIPFYANWGLTRDRHVLERRSRSLNINELTAGTLIMYPIYFDWTNSSFINAETVVDQLYEQSKSLADKKQHSIYSQKLSGYLNLFRALFTPYTK